MVDTNTKLEPRSRTHPKQEIELGELHEALIICAKLIQLDGEQYMPYFDRISDEIRLLQERSKKHETIRTLAEQSLPLKQSNLIQP